MFSVGLFIHIMNVVDILSLIAHFPAIAVECVFIWISHCYCEALNKKNTK